MIKNRDWVLIDGDKEKKITVVAECPHCSEPITLEGQMPVPTSLAESYNAIMKCYCRGANGLSLAIRCCALLSCNNGKDSKVCNLNPTSKKEYPVGKFNVIVVEEISNEL